MNTPAPLVFHPHPINKAFQNITGKVFGRLTILGYAGPKLMPSGFTTHRWHARCECGTVITTFRNGIGKTTMSCGCLHRESVSTHRLSHTPIHRVWSSMVCRCSDSNSKSFANYGGRGITVSDQWKGIGGFERFLAHMGPKPTPEHTLDRIDNEGNYEPGNVRWASMKVQQNNKRSNRVCEYGGVLGTVSHWAEVYSVNKCTLADRLDRGWSVDEAIETPVQEHARKPAHFPPPSIET